MADLFEGSRRKLARAEEHFTALGEKIEEFTQSVPYEKVTEPDAQKPDHLVSKVKLTRPLPDAIADIAADMVQNLRNALDIAAYAVAVASGKINPKFAAFPFAGSVSQMGNALGRSKDIPPQIQSLFCGFQPYPGGDDLLWALNEICVADKHKMLIPIGQGMVRRNASVKGTGYFSMPDPHVWNREKNEMELITLGPGATYDYEFGFHFFVAFNEIRVVDGQPVLVILQKIGTKVDSILTAIEAETKRIGIIP